MNTRVSIFIAILIAAVGFGMMNMLSSMKEPPAVKEQLSGSKSVYVRTVNNDTVQTQFEITGPLQASDRVQLFAEVSGILLAGSKEFKEGVKYAAGETLLRLDDSEARLSLVSQRSSLQNAITQLLPDLKLDYPDNADAWAAYAAGMDVERNLKPLPEVKSEKEAFFITSRNIRSQYYTIRSQEERLSKYRIAAPFTGVLTESMVDPGTLVRAGQQLGTYISSNQYEMEASVPLSQLSFLEKGDPVALESPDIMGSWQGRVKRISSHIDPSSQSVKVYIGLSGDDLREGMYLSGHVFTGNLPDAVSVSRELLLENNRLYIVESDQLKAVQVEILRDSREDVVVRGLPQGALLLAESVPGAYDGMDVTPVNK